MSLLDSLKRLFGGGKDAEGRSDAPPQAPTAEPPPPQSSAPPKERGPEKN